MNAVDDVELEVFAFTADIEAAELAGVVVRETIDALAATFAELLGVSGEQVAAELWARVAAP
jgi:hypothetical protein